MSNKKKADAKWHQNYRLELLIFVGLAGAMSGAFNVYGALITYAGLMGYVYSAIMVALEGIALFALHRMLTDWSNNHHVKAIIAAVIFAAASGTCAMSGKRAFNALTSDTTAAIATELAQAARLDERAKAQWALAAAETDVGSKSVFEARGDRYKRQADQARADQAKRKPMGSAEQWILLATLEIIKALGIWSLATKTSRRMTKRQIDERNKTKAGNAAAKSDQRSDASKAAQAKAAKESLVARPNFGAKAA